MTPADIQICRDVINTLSSKSNSKKNYLFLEPVNLIEFPTYKSIIERPMDLGTVAKNLRDAVYATREQFFADCALCFENAIKFNKADACRAWILKYAKDMMRLLNKEKKRAEKNYIGGGGSLKLKLGKKDKSSLGGGGELQKSAKLKLSLKSPSISVKDAAFGSGDTTSKEWKKKSKNSPLVVSSDPVEDGPMIQANNTPAPKVKLSFKIPSAPISDSSQPKVGGGGAKNIPVIKAISNKPKFKLKMSLNRTLSSSNKTTPKSSTPSRGKELPSGVVTTQMKKQPSSDVSSLTVSPTKKSQPTTPTSRGKELPKTVSASSSSNVSRTKPEKYKSGGISPKKSTMSSPAKMKPVKMTPSYKAQCSKVISALKHREKNVGWFLKPVNDPKLNDDYRAKIAFPIDLGTISSKLDRNQYPTLSEFALDVRRIFSNCLRFNDNAENPLRPIACEMLSSAEIMMHLFIQQPEAAVPLYPKLLYCWKMCMQILDEILKLKNPDDGFPTAHFFLHPVSHFWGGKFKEDYKEKVTQPMDLGTVTAKLCDGTYQTVQAFIADCHLVPSNCKAYYSKRDDGTCFISQAERLSQFMSKKLETLLCYDVSVDGIKAKKIATNPNSMKVLNKPPIAFFSNLLEELRGSTYTDKFTKVYAFFFDNSILILYSNSVLSVSPLLIYCQKD